MVKTTKCQKGYICSGDQLDAYAKKIGWFNVEPSEYTGVGNYKTRKAPSSKASEYKCKTIKKGMDGKMWKVICDKNSVKKWIRK